MAGFECCHKCKPPKRAPGCHDHCEEYQDDRAAYDAKKAEDDRKRRLSCNLNSQTIQAARKASRRTHSQSWRGKK